MGVLQWAPEQFWAATVNDIHQAWVGHSIAKTGKDPRQGDTLSLESMRAMERRLRREGRIK